MYVVSWGEGCGEDESGGVDVLEESGSSRVGGGIVERWWFETVTG